MFLYTKLGAGSSVFGLFHPYCPAPLRYNSNPMRRLPRTHTLAVFGTTLSGTNTIANADVLTALGAEQEGTLDDSIEKAQTQQMS